MARRAHSKGLTAVIFCGPGSNLYPFCDSASSSVTDLVKQDQTASTSFAVPRCKALLDVANRPLLSYPLQWIFTAGLRTVLVLARESDHAAIAASLRTVRLATSQETLATSEKQRISKAEKETTGSNIVVTFGADGHAPVGGSTNTLNVELLPLGPHDKTESSGSAHAPAFSNRSLGTAELLRWLLQTGRLDSDPLIVPVDLVATAVPLADFMAFYHASSIPFPPTVASLLYERGAGEGLSKEREKEASPKLLAAYADLPMRDQEPLPRATAARLLALQDFDDLASDDEMLLRISLLEAHPRLRLTTSLLDAHVYILSMLDLLPLLDAYPAMTSLKEHVVPFVAKCGWQEGLTHKVGWHGSSGQIASPTLDEYNKFQSNDITLLSAHSAGSHSKEHKCFLPQSVCMIVRSKSGFFARANTVTTYMECNRQCLRALQSATPGLPSVVTPRHGVGSALPDPALQTPLAQFSSDSLVAPGILVGDRAIIKRSVVGLACSIGRGVNLTGCIVMRGAQIGENSRLENCIVGAYASIGDRSTLRDCDVGPCVVLSSNLEAKHEKFDNE